jgi:hypothetical protein
MSGAPKPEITELAGRYFHVFAEGKHVFAEGNKVDRQGVVLASVGPAHYLVRYFDFVLGEPSTMAVVSIEEMACAPKEERTAGTWQFYEDAEQMNNWYSRHAKPR